MTNEEYLIQFFINEFKNSKTNIVKISRNSINKIGIPEEDIIRSIYILQEDGLINIKNKSVHNDFNRFWEIALKSDCIHYFEQKEQNKKENLKDHFRFWLPLIISIIALIVAA